MDDLFANNEEQEDVLFGNLEYDKFIKKLPTDKYKFIDGAYIMLEPLTKEEILKLLDGE